MRLLFLLIFPLLVATIVGRTSVAQAPPLQNSSPPPGQAPAPPASTMAQKSGGQVISLEEAIRIALQHDHNLLAERTTILQNQAEEITANLRPDPVMLGDTQFLPVFQPGNFSSDYLDNIAQFDLGLSYLFERGKKRQHRLQAARDVTAVSRAQVDDNERTLTYRHR